MNVTTPKSMQGFKSLIGLNFIISAILLIAASILSFSDNYSIFTFNTELYGPIGNNLRIMMVYMVFAEIAMIAYCYHNKNFQDMLIVGAFLVLIAGSLEFYSQANQIPIDLEMKLLFLYVGLSHVGFGALYLNTPAK